MKKISLLVVFAFIATMAMSQITPVKELSGLNNAVTMLNSTDIYIQNSKTSFSFYDENFALKKTATGLPESSNVLLVSKNLFTTSGKYEFVLKTTDNQYKLYDDAGNMIYNFADYAPTRIVNNKLQAIKFTNVSGELICEHKFFSIQGSLISSANPTIAIPQNMVEVYPNPAQSHINIRYNIPNMELLKITNVAGQEVENILLDPYQNEVIINTTHYPAGVYIYNCGGASGKIVVQ